MRSLLQLAANPEKASCPGRGTGSLRPSSTQSQGNRLSTARSPEEMGDRTELSSFLTSVIEQAVSHFEQYSHMENLNPGRPMYQSLCAGEPDGEREQPTLLWAMWIMETMTELTREDRERYRYFPNRTADEDSAVSSCIQPPSDSTMRHSVCGKVDHHATPSLSVALSTVWSSRAFTAVLLSATSRRYNTTLRCSAYSLCASMLDVSLSDASASERDEGRSEVRGGEHHKATTTEVTHNGRVDQTQPQNGGYVLPSQERAVARAFSEQLQSGASMRNLSSPLLKSQLELLVQWQRRKKALGGEGSTEQCHVPDSVWGTTEPQSSIDSPFVFDNSSTYACRQSEEGWDAATPFVAGPGGAGDVFEVDHPTNTHVAGPRRPGTADSEPSALSNLPGCSVSDNTASTDITRMFIETVTATSVTLSWGGSHEDPLDLLAGADGDGSICTTSHQAVQGSGSRASTLVQALRAKARHAGGRRPGPGVVLKVRTIEGAAVSEQSKLTTRRATLASQYSYSISSLADTYRCYCI